MFAGTALSVCLLVYAGLSLFIISGPYLYVVVCVLYVYNLTEMDILVGCINEGLVMGHLSQAVHYPGELLVIHHGLRIQC